MFEGLDDLTVIPTPKQRDVYLYDGVDHSSVGQIVVNIQAIEKHDQHIKKVMSIYGMEYVPKPIVLHISSYGGSVPDGFGLISVMNKSTTPVDTVVEGYAMSMALVIASQGRHRRCHSLSTYMLHQMVVEFEGKMKDMSEDMEENERVENLLFDILMKRTKITNKQISKNKKSKKDWYITPKEALKLGIVDEII